MVLYAAARVPDAVALGPLGAVFEIVGLNHPGFRGGSFD
jgi:hypothetical protein